jgi:hypothetical protein
MNGEMSKKHSSRIMKKVVTSVSSNNHEPSGEISFYFHCHPFRAVNRTALSEKQQTNGHEKYLTLRWQFPRKMKSIDKKKKNRNRNPKHLDDSGHLPIDYVPSLLTVFLCFFSICSYQGTSYQPRKQDEHPLVRWLVEISYFAACFC